MPQQTTLRTYMKVADGTALSIKVSGESVYTGLGVVTGDTNVVLEWDEFQEESANAGKSPMYVKNPRAVINFDLQNLNKDNISRLSSGLMTKSTTAASPVATIPDQDIASGWTDEETHNLIMYTSSSDNTQLKMATQPVLTSVTADPDGTPEVLTEDTDYFIIEDSDSPSGWSIGFMSANFGTASEGDEVEIVYGSNTPVARATYTIGESVQELTDFDLKLEHTDEDSLVYGVQIYKCYSNSGSLQFMFKSAAESAYNSMPFNCTGILDTSRSAGDQLMNVYEDTGAQ